MASGTINFDKSSTAGGSYIIGKITWSSSTNSSANTSDVTAKLYVKKLHPDMTLTEPTSGTWSYRLSINGEVTTSSVSLSVLESWVLVATKTVSNIQHGTDGSKTINISGWVSAPSATTLVGHKTDGSEDVDLNTIARAATIESLKCSTSYLDGTITATYTPKSASHYIKRIVYLNSPSTVIRTADLGQKSASQQTSTINFSASELSTIYGKLPSTTSAVIKVAFLTYSDSGYKTQVGSAQSKTITLTIPTSVKPTASLAVAAVNSNTWIKSLGAYVAGYSQVKLTLTASAGEGAKISSTSISGDDFSVSGTTVTANLAASGTFTFTGKAVDSRGRSASDDKKITVLAYSQPAIASIKVERGEYTTSWAASENGPDVRVLFKTTLDLVDEGNTYGVSFELDGSSVTPNSGATSGLVSDSSRTVYFLDVDGEVSHTLTMTATDKVGATATASIVIPSINVTVEFNESGKGVAFGKTSEKEGLECAWPAYFSDNIKVESGTTNKVIENRRITPPDATDDEHKDVRMQLYVGDSGFPSCRNQYSTDGGENWITRSYWRLQDDGLYVDGLRVPEIQHGNVSIVPSAANTPTGLAVTFEKSFSGPPDIIASSHTSVPGTTVIGVGTSSRSATGCMIYVTRTNTTATTVNWIAIY